MNPEKEQPGRRLKPSDPVVTVNIFGADYAIRTGADSEYIRKIAAHVDRTMREVSGRVSHVSATKIAVLAALQITDQLHAERQAIESGEQQLAERTDTLLSRLEQTLLETVE